MKKILYLVAGLVFFSGQVFAQDTIPNEQVVVNKKYDEQGNLIQYDSTYVHQWSSTSDSMSSFVFPDDDFFTDGGFPDMEKFFQEFSDEHNMPDDGSSPFDDEFFKHFRGMMPDSMMNRQFFAHRDTSYFSIPVDSLNRMQQGGIPDFDELMQEIHEHFKNFPENLDIAPQFKSQEQQTEWEQLMKKQRQEMEEFREKWENKD